MSLFKIRALHPNHVVIGAFLREILTGTVSLCLPLSAARERVSIPGSNCRTRDSDILVITDTASELKKLQLP